MKAIVKEVKTKTVRLWIVFEGTRIRSVIYFPNELHPESFTVEFLFKHGVVDSETDIPDLNAAIEKCQELCKKHYGIDEITDEKGYPLKLLGCFEDPLFDDVKP